MIQTKIIVALSTFLIGFFYTRKEMKALWQCIREKDYVSLHELNKQVARREMGI